MKDISLPKAYVVALWMEALLYGVYSVLFAICYHVLVYQPRKRKSRGISNRPLLATAIIMFVLCSVRVCLDLGRAISAFVSSDDIGGPEVYFNQLWIWSDVLKQALYVTNNVVADCLVVYRCYVVWGYSWKIIAGPVLMLIGTTVCGYVVVVNFSLVKPGEDVFSSDIMKWATGLFSMSLATNIIVTSLIAVRIWWISRRTINVLGKKHGRKYVGAMAIVLESGALYSVSLLTLLILYLLKTNAQFIVYDALAQIMGIVPTLIIVRVGLGLSTQDTHNTTLSGLTSTIDTNTGGTSVRGTIHNASSNIPMQIRKIIEVEDHSDADIDLEGSLSDARKSHGLQSHERVEGGSDGNMY